METEGRLLAAGGWEEGETESSALPLGIRFPMELRTVDPEFGRGGGCLSP